MNQTQITAGSARPGVKAPVPTWLQAPAGAVGSRARAAVGVDRRQAIARIGERATWDGEQPGLAGHRAISLVAALGLLWPIYEGWWSEIVAVPAVGLATIALTGGALLLAALMLAVPGEEELARLDVWLLALALLTVIVSCVARLDLSSGYGTDEAAFVHGAAATLLHGHDPYGASLRWTLSRFGVLAGRTLTMGGGMVTTLGYPAVPVLLAVPFVAAMGGGQAVALADVLVLVILTGASFFALPRRLRPLAVILCVCVPALLDLAVSGLVAIPALAALVPVAWRWARVGEGGRLQRRDRVAALALGVAISTSQLAWFIAPFVLVGITRLRGAELGARRAVGLTARFGAGAALTFALLNLPFIAWGPGAWLAGISAPLLQHAIPDGQGLVGLSVFLRLGGGDLAAYTYSAAALYLAALILYSACFARLGRACFLLPAVAMYVSGRSLAEYWLALGPVIVIAALGPSAAALRTAGPPAAIARLPRAIQRLAAALTLMPAALALALALRTPAPLGVQVLAAPPDAAHSAVARLRVALENHSGAPLRPHFIVNSTGQALEYWRILSGPRTLAPRARGQYLLAAEDASAFITKPFVVQALTASPPTISVSSVVVPAVQTQALP